MAIVWTFKHGDLDGYVLQGTAIKAFHEALFESAPSFAAASSFVMETGDDGIVFEGVFQVTPVFPPSVTGGTISGFRVYHGGVEMFEASGYALDYDALMDGLTAAKTDPQYGVQQFYALLMPGPMTIKGSDDADTTMGSAFADHMALGGAGDFATSAGGDDFVSGGDGDDYIRTEDGNDWVSGGNGMDSLYGGTGVDTADYSEESEFVEVTLNGSVSANVLVGGSVEDTISGIENLVGGRGNDVFRGDGRDNRFGGGVGDDRLNGGSGNDRLVGQAGADKIAGNAGNDEINGGRGRDKLTGGLDSDRFVFDTGLGKKSGKTNADTILDFASGRDRIVLDADVFRKLDAGVVKSKFFAAGNPDDDNDTIVFSQGKLYYDRNGDGEGGAKLIAKLAGDAKLHADDLFVA